MMNVLGLDASLRCTGYATLTGRGTITLGLIRTTDAQRGPERLAYIRDEFRKLLDRAQPDLVCIEGYAMGISSKGGRAFDIGELGGVLKLEVYESRIDLLVVPPTNLKLFATGSGGADKELIRKRMSKHLGRLITSLDESDACALLYMGMMYADRRSRPRDPRHHQNVALRGTVFVSACAS